MGESVGAGGLEDGLDGEQGGGEDVSAGGWQMGDSDALVEVESGESAAEPGDFLECDAGGACLDVDSGLCGEDGACDDDCASGGDDRLAGREGHTGVLEGMADVGLDGLCNSWVEGRFAVGEEAFAEADGAELEGDGLLDAVFAEVDEFEAAAAKIDLEEAVEGGELRIGGEAAADEAGFFGAAEDVDGMSGGGLHLPGEIASVEGVADGAGGDDTDGSGLVEEGEAKEFAEGPDAGLHGLGGKAREFSADAAADAGLDGLGEERLNGAVAWSCAGDEELDGVASDINDGYSGGGWHGLKIEHRRSKVEL